jgi:hypothetical protein
MSANVRALTITGAILAAVTYLVCAAFVALARVGRSVTWGGAVIGGTFFAVFVALVCASSGWLYNRLDQRET